MTATAQDENLERVRERIAATVLEFCRPNHRFHMAELCDFVRSRLGVAPDSPGRILRSLRQSGKVRYYVVSRRDSIYQVEPEVQASLFDDPPPDWEKG